jgi:hypothetical protein
MKTRLKLFLQATLASLKRIDLKMIFAAVPGIARKAVAAFHDFLKVFGETVYETRELIDAAIGLSAVVAFILIVRAFAGCGHSANQSGRGTSNVPVDTNFVSIQHVPVGSSASALKKVRAKIPKGVPTGSVNKVVQIKLKTGDTLQVVIASTPSPKLGDAQGEGLQVYVAKDSMISSVTVLDVKPPLLNFGLYPDIGATMDITLRFSPSVALSFLRIGKYRLPVLSADLTGLGIGVGYEILPDIQVSALYGIQFSAARTVKLGAHYEF